MDFFPSLIKAGKFIDTVSNLTIFIQNENNNTCKYNDEEVITEFNKLILNSIKEKPDYIALGSFFKSKLKPRAKKAKKNLVKWCKQRTDLPIVAIGGIDNKNYKSLIKFGVNYLAISSFIWNNPRLKPKKAIREFRLK